MAMGLGPAMLDEPSECVLMYLLREGVLSEYGLGYYAMGVWRAAGVWGTVSLRT